MDTLRVISAVGARPNFMKIAPFIRAIDVHNTAPGDGARIEHILVHTGQHYDASMSDAFFKTLKIPAPDVNLEVGSGTHAEQVGKTMMAFEATLARTQPDWVVVVGDVNATCACSITAKKAGIRVAHIEAGLRSFDMTMPEEINRIITDRLADLLFTPDRFADDHLRHEGVPNARIHQVGNIMIDTLESCRPAAQALAVNSFLGARLVPGQRTAGDALEPGILDRGFALVTLHRPVNVDDPGSLRSLVEFFLGDVAPELPVIWTLHPRTRARLASFGLWDALTDSPRMMLVEPLDYLEMLRLNMDARIILTDSGGLQEECCVLGTPCLTLREHTERPITLEMHGGVSRLVGNSRARLRDGFRALRNRPRTPFRPPLWDGHTAERIVRVLARAAAD